MHGTGARPRRPLVLPAHTSPPASCRPLPARRTDSLGRSHVCAWNTLGPQILCYLLRPTSGVHSRVHGRTINKSADDFMIVIREALDGRSARRVDTMENRKFRAGTSRVAARRG